MSIYIEWFSECLSLLFRFELIDWKNKQTKIFNFVFGLTFKNICPNVTIHPFSNFISILFTTSIQFCTAKHWWKWTCDRSVVRFSIFGPIKFWNWNNETSFETDHQAKFRGAISWAGLFSFILLQIRINHISDWNERREIIIPNAEPMIERNA